MTRHAALDQVLIESRRGREARTGGAAEAKGPTKFQRAAALLYELCFDKQRRILTNPRRRIAARCPRRAGKTTVVRARLMRRCLLFPGSNCLYIALTRPSAERLMWLGKSGLKAICKALDLVEGVDVFFHNAKLLMTFANGSSIQLAGASSTDEIDKFRGDEYDEVWIDESKSYTAKLFRELLEEALEPALLTRMGVLGMIGTPGNVLDGKFYEVTRPGSEESSAYVDEETDGPTLWSFHEWTLEDNTAQPHQWAAALALRAASGWTDRNPVWRREYLGEWAADDTGYVYKFRKHLDDGTPWNIWKPGEATVKNPFGLPEGKTWNYVYGMDLGAADPFALEIVAYADGEPVLFQVYEFTVPAKTFFTSTQIGELLQSLIKKTGWPIALVSDHSHLGGSILAEIQTRFGIYIEPAPRGHDEKRDAIEITNGDLVDGRLKLMDRPGVKNHLAEQMSTLQWDESGQRELKSQSNHCCFVAGTMVETSIGPIAIEDVVAGMLVWTRDGLRPVVAAGSTGPRRVVGVPLRNGQLLVGTADHPVWTPGGWIELALLTPQSTLRAWENMGRVKSSSSRAFATGGTRSPSGATCASTSTASGGARSTERSGNMPMAWPSRMASTSTTSTRTRSTTRPATSPSSRALSTCDSMPALQIAWPPQGGMLRSPGPPPQPGMAHRRAWPGIESRGGASPPPPSRCSSSAWSAALSSRDGGVGRDRPFVAGHATPLGTAEVFNLTVAGSPEFFANGVLVHNCDALIYARRRALHHITREPDAAPPPKGTSEALVLQLQREEHDAAHGRDEDNDLAMFLGGSDVLQ